MFARVFAYILFSSLMVPVEIWTFVIRAMGDKRNDIVGAIYAHGLLYVVSIILMAETTFRLYHSRQRLRHKDFFEIICLFTLTYTIALVVFYESIEQALLGRFGVILDHSGVWQTRFSILSSIIAVATFILCEVSEDKSHLDRRTDFRFDYEKRQRR